MRGEYRHVAIDHLDHEHLTVGTATAHEVTDLNIRPVNCAACAKYLILVNQASPADLRAPLGTLSQCIVSRRRMTRRG